MTEPKMTLGDLVRDFFGGLLVSWGLRVLPSGAAKLVLSCAWVAYCEDAIKRNPANFQC